MWLKEKLKSNISKAGLMGVFALLIHLIPMDKILGIDGTMEHSFAGIPKVYYIVMIIVYALVALQLVKIKNNLSVGKRRSAYLIIFAYFYVIASLLSVLEGNFFIDNYPLLFNIISGIIRTGLLTIGLFWLWKQEDVGVNEGKRIAEYFKTRSIFSWVIRGIIVLLVSFVIYMIIGALAYPFTGPYMEAHIKIPSIMENFSIQVLRGLAYIIVSMPVMIFWSSSKKSLLGNLIIINILLYPVVGYAFTYYLPLAFRFMDATVLSLHMIAFSWLLVKFMSKK